MVAGDEGESVNIKVPEGMIEAALNCDYGSMDGADREQVKGILEAALLWQRENAPVPTKEQVEKIAADFNMQKCWSTVTWGERIAAEWIRRMYDAPEAEEGVAYITPERIQQLIDCGWKPEVPEEIKDLLSPEVVATGYASSRNYRLRRDGEIEEKIIEAFRRGQRSK